MKKLTQSTDAQMSNFPFSYFASRAYLDFAAYELERNGEQIIVTRDLVSPHEFPAIFLPTKKENWENCSVTFASTEARAQVRAAGIPILIENPVGKEFFYKTKTFIDPTGDFKNRISRFTNSYKYRLSQACLKNEILDFHERWKTQRVHDGLTFDESEKFFEFCLQNLEKYNIRQVYVLIDDALAGFAWGMLAAHGGWIGLHLKVDYRFRGLSRFLQHERAKLFSEFEDFTLGTASLDEPGIDAYKRELGPCREVDYSYILTGKSEAKHSL